MSSKTSVDSGTLLRDDKRDMPRQVKTYCSKWFGGKLWNQKRKNMIRLWYGGKIAELKSTKGQSFFVDVESLPEVKKMTWHAIPCKTTGKSYFGARKPKTICWHRSHVLLHRWLLKYEGTLMCDHWDGNPTNNSMKNIRLVTPTGNANNARMNKSNTSGENGVRFVSVRLFWRVLWSHDGKRKSKTFSRFDSTKSVELEQWLINLQQKGPDLNISTWKMKQKACYQFQWREDDKKRSKYFPPTPEGHEQALKCRQETYERIGNNNGKRLY